MVEWLDVRRVYQVVARRLGARALVAFVVFLALSIVFVSLASEVREQETLAFDRWVLLSIHHTLDSPFLDVVIPVLTHLGGTIGIVALGGVATMLCFYKRQPARGLLVLAGVGGAVVLNVVLKSIFERARPDLWQRLATETSFSFPSGHAMASAALACSVVAALWYSRYRRAAMVVGGGYVLAIGFTRLYLGVHYPTDIVAGWCVSAAWVAVVFAVFGRPRVAVDTKG